MASSSRRPHSWELYSPLAPGYAPAPEHGWDSDAEGGAPTAQEAGQHLASLLIKLRLAGTISAQQCCTLAHWASLAGAVGPCAEFALKPGNPSTGHYQRKLDAYLRVDEDPAFYMLPVPQIDKADSAREVQDLETVPPHEALAAEVAADPGLLERALRAGPSDWATNFTTHPAVVSAPPGVPVLPVAIYLDGVPFTALDGFLGIWIYNLITYKRHLVAVLRKSRMCDCGCRKWCSLYPVFLFLRWSFAALAAGLWPQQRHDGEPWRAGDGGRAEKAGQPMVRGAVVLVKGDWSEFCLTMGFPTWSTQRHPCLFCNCTRDTLYALEGFAPFSFPHRLRTAGEYEHACAAAEICVILTRADHAALLERLYYDKRPGAAGSHGRALVRDYAPLGLLKGDRLEPSPSLPDVGAFEAVASFPREVVFWRPSCQTSASHRNPLFAPETGVGLHSFGIDILHTLNLGIYQKLVARVWWALILADAWEVGELAGGRRNIDELTSNSAIRLRRDLFAWYGEFEAANPGVRVNRLSDLVVKTLGSREQLSIKTKAAETRPLLHFCAWLLARYGHKLSSLADQALGPASLELARFSELIRTCPDVPPPRRVQELHDAIKRYVVLAARAAVPPTPKLHLALHLVNRTGAAARGPRSIDRRIPVGPAR